jgi:hypothetical protein
MKAAREILIYDRRDCLGRIQVAANGQAQAFNVRGEPLGIFATESDALAAVSKVQLELDLRP